MERDNLLLKKYYFIIIITLITYSSEKQQQTNKDHYCILGHSKNWSKALPQVTLLQVIFPPVTSSVNALILPTPDGPALSNPTPDGSPLSNPTPDGSPPSPAQLQCDVDPVSALVNVCSTPSPVPSLSPAPTLDATASPAP